MQLQPWYADIHIDQLPIAQLYLLKQLKYYQVEVECWKVQDLLERPNTPRKQRLIRLVRRQVTERNLQYENTATAFVAKLAEQGVIEAFLNGDEI